MNKTEYYDEFIKIGDKTVFVRKSDSGCEVLIFPENDKDDIFTFNLDRESLQEILDYLVSYFLDD